MPTERTWTPPTTYEQVTKGGRVLRYCLYGPEDGVPVIHCIGSPATRWLRPDRIERFERSGLRQLVYDRPGYGGSTRQPGRTVADAVTDAVTLANAQGWESFAVNGGSGGGPHALACAALLPHRVTRCAVVSGIKPPDVSDLNQADLSKLTRLSVLGEDAVRPHLENVSHDIMTSINAGAPEVLPPPGAPEPDPTAPQPPRAIDDPAAMARLQATFVDGMDGWVDDNLAYVRPWGFEMKEIKVPVSIWYGRTDTNIPNKQSEWLIAHIPGAEAHEYDGGHLPDAATHARVHTWLRDEA
jgi:pimeloyl-ACP methyl ester carboxylesterase